VPPRENSSSPSPNEHSAPEPSHGKSDALDQIDSTPLDQNEDDLDHAESSETASHVVLSYPSELSTWGRDIVEGDPFRAYLPKAHDRACPGDVWEEFVGVGCCGDALDVPLRVESVEGAAELTSATTFEFTVREACLAGGWEVQSEASPE